MLSAKERKRQKLFSFYRVILLYIELTAGKAKVQQMPAVSLAHVLDIGNNNQIGWKRILETVLVEIIF